MIKKHLKSLLIAIAVVFVVSFAVELACGPVEAVICKDGVCRLEDPKRELKIEHKGIIVSKVPFSVTVRAVGPEGEVQKDFEGETTLALARGALYTTNEAGKKIPMGKVKGFKDGSLTIKDLVIESGGKNTIKALSGDVSGEKKVRVIPGFLTVLPPLIAIILALTLRQVVISLFAGVWLGAVFIYDYNPFTGLLRMADTLLIKSVASTDHVSIIVFSLFLGGMVAVIGRSGGSQGMVDIIKKYAKNPSSGQIATWAMGLFIFFDDYANTLIVGNSMRPLTDKLKISREKLSFLVDATAAPVTNIAVISTWIGFEIGVIGDNLKLIGSDKEPYIMFLETIPYRFYPVLMILFVFLIGYLCRDFGPMLTAEIRARTKGQLLAPGAKPLSSLHLSPIQGDKSTPRRWYNAVVPIVAVIVFTLLGLYYSGARGVMEAYGADALKDAKLYQILDKANSFNVLLWASLGGSIIAIVMVLAQKILTLEETISTWIEGLKSLMPAVVILSLAWSIGAICKELNTGGYIALLAKGNIQPQLLPVLIFVLSAVISFATGTSWGTMSIVMPIAIYVGWHLPPADMAESLKNAILLGSVSGVLAGATFGDHCSPISDTTIMSSMASAADHVDHVRTQMPYAIMVAGIGIVFGTIPAGYGVNPWICVGVCTVLVFLVIRFLGKNPDDMVETAKAGDDKKHPKKMPEEEKEPGSVEKNEGKDKGSKKTKIPSKGADEGLGSDDKDKSEPRLIERED